MKIVEEVFCRYRVKRGELVPFGFVRENDKYRYDFEMGGGAFLASFFIDDDGKVSEKITEKEFGDEFLGMNVKNHNGLFINSLREEYTEKLIVIRDACFFKVLFKNDQSNRIAERIVEKHGEIPDNPFKEPDDYGVFRYKGNGKWYGLIMDVKGERLDDKYADEIIEIINIKIDVTERDELLKKEGIYPAYHMNHVNWISVILDDTVKDEELLRLLEISRNFAMAKSGKKIK